MKILFIDNYYDDYVFISYRFSMGLLTLATILKEKGMDVEIVNFIHLFREKILDYNKDTQENFKSMAEYIIEKKPFALGFTTMSNSFHNSLVLSRFIKEKNKDIKIILGGPQASILPEDILKEYEWIDLICVGEGENTIADIIEGLKSGKLNHIPGIVFRNNGIIVKNKPVSLTENLDDLPLLNYNLIPDIKKFSIFSIDTGRGCPCNCTYCVTSTFWRHKFRTKSIERICKEMLHIKRFLNKETFSFSISHDNFTADYNFLTSLCGELKKLNLTWLCNGRADSLDEKLIKLMAGAGCKSVFIGIETGSQRIQKSINKNLNLKKVSEIIDILLENHININASFMYGFPEETEEDLNHTLNMIYSLIKKDGIRCKLHSLCILSGTKIFEDYKDKLVLRDYCSNIADDPGIKYCKSLININENLFPHFYTIENTTADRYPLLEKFINNILVYYRNFPETFELLIKSFNNDILEFYKDFLDNSHDDFRTYFKNGGYLKRQSEDMFESLNFITFFVSYLNRKKDDKFKVILSTFHNKITEMIHQKKLKITL